MLSLASDGLTSQGDVAMKEASLENEAEYTGTAHLLFLPPCQGGKEEMHHFPNWCSQQYFIVLETLNTRAKIQIAEHISEDCDICKAHSLQFKPLNKFWILFPNELKLAVSCILISWHAHWYPVHQWANTS